MSFNLLDAVKGHFSTDLVSKAASFMGESEGGVSKAITGILPTLLSGLASKSSTSEGATEVANMASDAHNSGILGNLGSFFGGGDLLHKGGELVKGLFGGKLDGIMDVVSSVSGLKSGSAGSLMGMALPMILGTLGKHSADNNLGASGISSLLSSGKSSWASMLPSGLGSLLGLGGVASAVTGGLHSATSSVTGGVKNVTSSVSNYADDTVGAAKGGVKWLLPLLLLAALGFLAYWLLGQNGGCGKKDDVVVTTPTTDTTGNYAKSLAAANNVVVTTKESMKVKLAGGTEIDAYKGGIESQLVAFLDDKAATIDTAKGNWYDFDNLNFKLGKSDLTDSSMVQIKNIAAILKAYPAVNMKIGGYTDASGDAAKNMTLSQARADAVMAAIKGAGGNAAQLIKAEGYGSKFAKEPATASDEARRKDRRTAVKIVSK
jgi:outer membrane protein OmpA-like peptidoglycan-associated protein